MVGPSVMIYLLLIAIFDSCSIANVLYPVESESREVRTLHGLWNFKISPLTDQLVGFDEQWYSKRFEMVSQCKNINVSETDKSEKSLIF